MNTNFLVKCSDTMSQVLSQRFVNRRQLSFTVSCFGRHLHCFQYLSLVVHLDRDGIIIIPDLLLSENQWLMTRATSRPMCITYSLPHTFCGTTVFVYILYIYDFVCFWKCILIIFDILMLVVFHKENIDCKWMCKSYCIEHWLPGWAKTDCQVERDRSSCEECARVGQSGVSIQVTVQLCTALAGFPWIL